jgi:hypothetical protein
MQPGNFRECLAYLPIAALSAVAVVAVPAVSILLVLHRIADQIAKTGATEAANRGTRKRRTNCGPNQRATSDTGCPADQGACRAVAQRRTVASSER